MCCTVSIPLDSQHSHVISRTSSILEVMHRIWWHPSWNFAFKQHPDRRPFGHCTLMYGAKLVASLSIQIFMLASVFYSVVPVRTAHSAEEEHTPLPPSWLLLFTGASVQPSAVALAHMYHLSPFLICMVSLSGPQVIERAQG